MASCPCVAAMIACCAAAFAAVFLMCIDQGASWSWNPLPRRWQPTPGNALPPNVMRTESPSAFRARMKCTSSPWQPGILRDLRPWPVGSISLDTVERAQQTTSRFRVQIIDGTVHAVDFPNTVRSGSSKGHNDWRRLRGLLPELVLLASRVRLPDVDMVLNVQDEPLVWSNEGNKTLPIFSVNKAGSYDILMPYTDIQGAFEPLNEVKPLLLLHGRAAQAAAAGREQGASAAVEEFALRLNSSAAVWRGRCVRTNAVCPEMMFALK